MILFSSFVICVYPLLGLLTVRAVARAAISPKSNRTGRTPKSDDSEVGLPRKQTSCVFEQGNQAQ